MYLRKLILFISVLGLLTTSLVIHSESTFAQPQRNIDIALAVNGSGSIDPVDFAIQKDGIQAALANPAFFPRDGSIGFALVQYANGITQTHIPLTPITNANISQIVNAVSAIQQIQGLTNPGDGINTSTNILANANSNTQIICLSTDGVENSGFDTATAAANAQNRGVDRLTVIAIEDPPSFLEQDANDFYGPIVFGGGLVTFARNSTEFANLVGATCLGEPTELVGIEIIQTIQDWNNDVPLVEDKTTYIRLHVQPQNDANEPVIFSARIRASRNGTLLGRTSPINSGDANNNIPAGSIRTTANAASRRANFNDSLNFRLPDDWLNGTVEFTVEAPGLDCSNAPGVNQDCQITRMFQVTNGLNLKMIDVRWRRDGLSPFNSLGVASLTDLVNRATAIFPAARADVNFEIGSLIFEGGFPTVEAMNRRLLLIRENLDQCFSRDGCSTIYYGAITEQGVPPGGTNGSTAGNIPDVAATSTIPVEADSYGRNVHAHELGHALGSFHTIRPPVITETRNGQQVQFKEGPCGSQSGPEDPDFPIEYFNTIGDNELVTISPMNFDQQGNLNLNDPNLIFGLDTYLRSGQLKQPAVVDPRVNTELMSYCPILFIRDIGTWHWISDESYNRLTTAVNDTFPASTNVSQTQTQQDLILFRGAINLETDSVEFDPFATLPLKPTPTPPSGSCTCPDSVEEK